jgi:YesN/AraC family two-component response regulator
MVLLSEKAGGCGMCAGQQTDIDSEGRKISLEELTKLVDLKTGALFSCSCMLGCIAANASKEMIDAVCKIIEKDYEKDISLAEIAYKFNISQSYLSELFKKYTGDNFKNYVNRKKIDKAKEIIENNKQIKVKQLSEMLGFNDVNTFIKVFGKYEGMSPGQYAKTMAMKSEQI